MSSAGHGHSEGIAGFKMVPWLHCTVWGGVAGRTPAWHNTETSSGPGHPVTLQTRPTEHSQDPAAPLTQPKSSPRGPVAALTHPSSVHGHPSLPPALAPQPCPSRAAPGAELWALLQHHATSHPVPAPGTTQLPLHGWGQCQLLRPGLASRQEERVVPST